MVGGRGCGCAKGNRKKPSRACQHTTSRTSADLPLLPDATRVIGEETSQRLDVIPAHFRVIVTHRPKYACRACEQVVVQAPAPERLIKGGLPTEAMIAYMLVAKYAGQVRADRTY